MKSFLTLLSVAALVGVGFAGGISGQVLDAVSGEPVVGALVVARAEGGAAAQTRTNARGRYLFENLRPGEYRVRAAARGYEPADFPRPVPVREGQVTENIDFRLAPVQNPDPGAIRGRVVDRRTGEPIRGARVMAHGRHGRRAARTNEQGEYLLRGLRPGEYRVSARARHHLPAEFPRPVTVEPGQVVEDINFALVPKPRKGVIAGRVVDARTGEPIAGAIVAARGEHGAGRVATNRAGYYRLVLPPGEYRVSARARGYQPAEFPRVVPVHPREVTRDVDFALERNALSHD